jgi:hypothetical protein
MKNPQAFIDILENMCKFKTKGSGPISFRLGMDFYCDNDGACCVTSLKYIEKMVSNYKKMYGELPKQVYPPSLEFLVISLSKSTHHHWRRMIIQNLILLIFLKEK